MSTPTEEGVASKANPFSVPMCFGTIGGPIFRAKNQCNDCSHERACRDASRLVATEKVSRAPSNVLAEPDTPPSKYHRLLKRKLPDGTVVKLWVDVYDILGLFQVTNPADQHALKKMLVPGKRGHKDENTDRDEAVWSLKRARELEEHRNA